MTLLALEWGALRRVSQRTWISAARTAVYGGLAALVAVDGAELGALLDAAILGAVLADFLTWFLWSIARLPEDLLHGGYDAAVNLLFGGLLFGAVRFTPGDDGSSIGVAFVTFMLTLGAKIAWHALESVGAALRD